MQNQMPAASAPAEQPQAPKGGASELVVDIQDKLMQLNDLMAGSAAITPEDKAKFQSILGAYESFVTDNLGSGAGQNPEPKEMPMKQKAVPYMAGAGKVEPTL